MRRRIHLTGPPGCGKTTFVGKVADILRDGVSGFYAEEIRDAKKQRIGFRVVTLDGKRGELADKYSVHGPRVGSYRVNMESFERVALLSLDLDRKLEPQLQHLPRSLHARERLEHRRRRFLRGLLLSVA